MDHQLRAISPIDGRYLSKTEKLQDYFSEYALIRYRLRVEIEYFEALCAIPLPALRKFPEEGLRTMHSWHRDFSMADAQRIKDIEKTTNHDVKAVEYFIKEKMAAMGGMERYSEFVHFGLTSQDINNTAVPLSLRDAAESSYFPLLEELVEQLQTLSEEWREVAMLAHTHGQPASPTRLGKEVSVFAERLKQQLQGLREIPHAAKFGGATGNFNAHHLCFPEIDWRAFGQKFVEEKLGLKHSWPTTQIEHYDHMAAFFDGLKRINVILLDLNRDFWSYISMGYFKQKIKEGEVGSSAMPHKVNPIDFENSEGNLGIANALLQHLSAKLPVSRLQRDLTDSTVLRSIGVPLGHILVGLNSTRRGLDKLVLNREALDRDLENNWAVVAEGIQNILRREAYPQPYEALKALTRTHGPIDKAAIQNFIEGLDVEESIKKELREISPQNYTGI